MKQAPKRALSVVLAFCLVLTMFTGLISTQAASPFPDLSTSHWAYDVIVGMYNMGFVKGDNKGNVKPESYVTTTEFMALINRMFGLYLTTSTNYTDTAGHWGNKENVFSYAAAQGYIIAESGNKIQPDAYLTREKAFALIARYLGLDEVNYGGFTDSSSMSSAYRGLINAAATLGIAEGYPDGSFKPQQYLRRSEAMKILYYMVGGNIISGSQAGVTNSSASKSQISAAITGRNAKLSNSTLRGTVYVSEGATNGTVTISNSSIGKLVVRASNATILLENSTVSEIETCSSAGGAVTINATGTSSVGAVTAKTSAALTDTTTAGSAFAKVTAMKPVTLTLTGTFPSVTVESTAAKTRIAGKGTINYISVKAAGVTTESLPVRYDIAKGLTAVFAGVTYSGSGTTSGVNSGFVAPYPYATLSTAYNGSKTINLNVKTVADGTVYALAYPAADAEPSYSTIISRANTSSGSYVGKSISVTANAAAVISLTVPGAADYEVAVLFVPKNGSQTTYSPVYGTIRENYTTYMGLPGNYDTGFVINPQITAYTANTAYAAGSVTVSFQSVLPGTVYLYAYNGTVPTYATIKTYGKAVALNVSNGGYTGTGTLTLNANTTYTGVAAYFVPNYATFAMSPVYSTALTVGSALVPANTAVSVGTGFYSGYPYISYYYGGVVKLTAKPQVSGKMYYAVVTTDYYPTAEEIYSMSSYNNAKCFSTGTLDVTAGTEKTSGTLSVPSNSTGYKIVAVLRSTTGYFYSPVSNSIASRNVLNAYTPNNASGFSTGSPYVYTVSADRRTVTLAATPLYNGTLYYAVVDSSYNPTAAEVAALTTSYSYCYAAGSRTVYANTSYTDLSMTLKNYGTVTSSMKVVAVLRTSTGYFVPVTGVIASGSVLYPYASAAVPTAQLTAATSYGQIADTAPLTLQFSELMYNTYASSSYLLSAQANAGSLFTLRGYNTATGKWENISSSLYSVSVTNTYNQTFVTFTPAAGKVWPAGYAIRVYVSSSVVNASRQTVQPASGYYQTPGAIVSTVTLPAYTVAKKDGVTGTFYNDVVYFEEGSTGAVATLTLTKKNASDKLYYKVNGGTAAEYTAALEIQHTDTKIEFWAENGGAKTAVKTITVTKVAKPVVTLNNAASGWSAASYATVAATVPSGGALYLGGTAGENTLAAVQTTTSAKTYLAADGRSLVTAAPSALTVASGTALKLAAEIRVNGAVVAKSADVTAQVGAVSGGAYAPVLTVSGLDNGKWVYSSYVTVTEPQNKPTNAASLKITQSQSESDVITASSGATKVYITAIQNGKVLSTTEPSKDVDYRYNPANITIQAAYYDADGKVISGTETTYTVPEFVTLLSGITAPSITSNALDDNNTWIAGSYVKIESAPALPAGYKLVAVLTVDGSQTDTMQITDTSALLYVTSSGKLSTTAPSATLQDGQSIEIVVRVVADGVATPAAESNTVKRNAQTVYETLVISFSGLNAVGGWQSGSTYAVSPQNGNMPANTKLCVQVLVDGSTVETKEVTPGAAYTIAKSFTLDTRVAVIAYYEKDGTKIAEATKIVDPVNVTVPSGNFTASSTIKVTLPSGCTFDAKWSWGTGSKTTTGLSSGTYYVDPSSGALQTAQGSGSFSSGNKTLTITVKQGSTTVGTLTYQLTV